MTKGAAAALLLLSAPALIGCGSDVRREDLEGQIATFVHRQTGADIRVRCPDHVKADRGTRVRCTTELSGAPTVIDIQFLDDGKFRITSMRVRPRT